jgi:hypothetical protein
MQSVPSLNGWPKLVRDDGAFEDAAKKIEIAARA